MRGLKRLNFIVQSYNICVASFTDAWIETFSHDLYEKEWNVASFTDAWIETAPLSIRICMPASHLLQMRGLKQFENLHTDNMQESHLLQMRGLKLICNMRTPRASVASFTDAWIETMGVTMKIEQIGVASFTDAWIETYVFNPCIVVTSSRIFYRCVD